MRAKSLKASFPVLALLVAALLLLPGAADAASLVIKPNQLVPYSTHQNSVQTPYWATGGAALFDFWYPLALPVGTVITGLRYQHASTGGNATAVAIIRAKPDATTPLQIIYWGTSNAATVTALEFLNVNGVSPSGAVTTVEAGWRYSVVAKTSLTNSALGRIIVSY